jgi:hypothetical protein
MRFLWLACLKGKGAEEKLSKTLHRGKAEAFSGAALIGLYLASICLILAGSLYVLVGAAGFCLGIGLFWRYNQSVHAKYLKAVTLKQGYLEEEEGSG